ncbi:hypothetical protein JCM11491_000472 [Sporobolomyces phaffii]
MAALVPQSIQYGDWIIIYSNRTQVTSDVVTPDKEVQSRYGHFKHNLMVGKPWGIKFPSSNGRGFVYLLKPTPELWTLALPHRTQILYLPDIAFITSYLNILPGSSVIEAGTGSGSFSHSLVRTVGGTGTVHSFEYHEERFEKAKAEFALHKLDHIVKIKHQNVYKDGFELEDEVDAVFLDLPAPWDALEHAKKAMRKDRPSRVCCFSPCIEQVIRTCTSLSELGFSDITMYETLTRTHDPVPVVPSLKPISSAIDRIKAVEVKKGKRRDMQILEAKRKREDKEKRAREESGEAPPRDAQEADGESTNTKRIKVEEEAEEAMEFDEAGEPEEDESASTPTTSHAAAKIDKEFVLKPSPYTRGHTSYLTFAVLLPLGQEKEGEEEKEAKIGAAEDVVAGLESTADSVESTVS